MDHSHHDHIGNSAPTNHKMDMSMHSMSFHYGVHETILFDFWKTESALGIIISGIIIMILAFLMESLRFFRNYRKIQNQTALETEPGSSPLRFSPQMPDLIDPMLQLLQIILAYLLMLIFMTFNVWLCIFTVLGEVISHLLYNTLFPFISNVTVSTNCC